ncbi:sulfurtransferase TusA family protein [Desulfonatronospira sp. MSAO_Bac3]|uniref:sulfurtransferase TusA family protein n=1 Tax=Desulfonatronospira sp. MSAO_Bac3 TaxID=2293857 RepID=UPI000FEF9D5D|nr:sulfurtransferase TusA family protein [Desulfonatronospira sp. MSAO_Bac3]RQD78621.1 MAG: sulfurtransferase TusA family protein [Desulfonatronospira sp. MSAO_Bac3]
MKLPPRIIADKVVDARGLSCPLPLLKTKKALDSLKSGQTVKIICTDPGSKDHIPDLGLRNGSSFLGMEHSDEDTISYFIQKD